MKKIVFAVMAVVAIGFATSCGNKTQQAETADSTEVATQSTDAEATLTTLAEQLNSGDASAFQTALAAVQEQIKNLDPEVAKEYVAQVQNFLKENADKIKEVAGDNAAITTAVSALTAVEPAQVVEGIQNALSTAGSAAAEAATETVNEQVDAAKQAAQQKVDEAKQAAKDKANEKVEEAKDAANKAVNDAANKAVKGLGL